MDVKAIFIDYYLDFGNYIGNFDKITEEINKTCEEINNNKVIEIFKKHQPPEE